MVYFNYSAITLLIICFTSRINLNVLSLKSSYFDINSCSSRSPLNQDGSSETTQKLIKQSPFSISLSNSQLDENSSIKITLKNKSDLLFIESFLIQAVVFDQNEVIGRWHLPTRGSASLLNCFDEQVI